MRWKSWTKWKKIHLFAEVFEILQVFVYKICQSYDWKNLKIFSRSIWLLTIFSRNFKICEFLSSFINVESKFLKEFQISIFDNKLKFRMPGLKVIVQNDNFLWNFDKILDFQQSCI